MNYQCTRNSAEHVSAAQAIAQGISEDGGLFVPESLPQYDSSVLEGMKDGTYLDRAERILGDFLTDFTPEEIRECVKKAYGGEKFSGGHPAPLVELPNCPAPVHLLELWHGPTCAFKDMALQLLPHLLTKSLQKIHSDKTAVILVATSGDTGKAALAGYAGLEGIQIAVFYPNAGTSEIQRLQMATQQGDNVAVFAVDGNFDDAQTGVKRVFADADVAAQLEARGIRLSSANSINWGRLVPQIVYYFYTYFRLAETGAMAWGQTVDFCVPTGNFGDILAGYYAKRMGLPVGRLVCASNENNVLTDFIRTGTYDARRAFHKTASPSMDILISSNLERLLYHVSGSAEKVAGWMGQLAAEGCYTVDAGTLAAIQESFGCGWADDVQGAEEIRTRFEQDHYLCDTHTAVAFRVADDCCGTAPMVVLSTASPFKFPRDVLRALGGDVPESDFDAMDALTAKTGCQAPAALAELKTRPVRFTETIAPGAIRDAALR